MDPHEIVKILLWEHYGDRIAARKHAERISVCPGPLSPVYAQAALLLTSEVNAFSQSQAEAMFEALVTIQAKHFSREEDHWELMSTLSEINALASEALSEVKKP